MVKRFIYELHKGVYRDNGVELSTKEVVELLNMLHEENEELNSKVEYEKKQHRHWKTECLTSIKEVSQLKKDILEVSEENKQLKLDNNHLITILASIKGAFEENSILTKSEFEKVMMWND